MDMPDINTSNSQLSLCSFLSHLAKELFLSDLEEVSIIADKNSK